MIRIIGNLTYVGESYKDHDLSYRDCIVEVKRASGVSDYLNLRVPENLWSRLIGTIEVQGDLRTYSSRDPKYTTRLMVYPSEIRSVLSETPHENKVDYFVEVFAADKFRSTPSGRTVTDLLLGYKTRMGTYNKFRSIAWGVLAEELSEIPKGTRLHVTGRLQSREYTKVVNEEPLTYVAHEVSLDSKIEMM